MPRSNGQCSRWTGRRAVKEEHDAISRCIYSIQPLPANSQGRLTEGLGAGEVLAIDDTV